MDAQADAGNVTASRLGVLLLAIGILLGADALLGLRFVYRLWPLLITVLALGLLGIYHKSRRRMPAFLAAGTYLLCFSVLALHCSLTSWGAMAHLWPLFIAFLGFVFLALYGIHSARRFSLLAGCLLLSLAAVFGILRFWGGQHWWTAFLLAGISILLVEKGQ
ncbi:MAG: hypothetical protein JXR77_04615 [Lentisphaeria bacterium]|nr:hypothetical protein [Lentisphaeria bacterium]